MQRTIRTAFLYLSAILLTECLGPSASAAVRLPRILGSHMVVQRDRPIHVWGWSDPGESVTVSLGSASRAVNANQLGEWSADLPPLPAGGPFTVTIQGASNRITLDDVLVGDVWFASGQSNMEMPLAGFPHSAVLQNGAEEIRNANHPQIRLLLIEKKASPFPLADFAGGESWTVCTPETATSFSAVAYFFGRDIESQEHVPVGLIDSTWGGTPAEAWTSLEGLAGNASLMPAFAARAQMMNEYTNLPLVIAAEKRADAEARQKGQTLPAHPWRPDPASWDPSWLYNGMIAPAIGFGIRGAIWYQGESNAGPERASFYDKLFPAMIEDWRAHWRQGNFPFFFVQIANFDAGPIDDWPLVREAQRRTLHLANTAMTVTIDIGESHNIHPADKQAVGRRLALAARALVYGESVEYSGPAYREVSADGTALRVWFDHVAGGLVAKGELNGFEVSGANRKFIPASARIEGNTVLVSAPQITAPQFVRYAWQNDPRATLFNGRDLPASPFTSEETLPTN